MYQDRRRWGQSEMKCAHFTCHSCPEPHEPVARTEYVVGIEREVEKLRALLVDARSELGKQIRGSRVVFDRGLRDRIDAVLGRYKGDDCVFCHADPCKCVE
jgi:hypothetical protein